MSDTTSERPHLDKPLDIYSADTRCGVWWAYYGFQPVGPSYYLMTGRHLSAGVADTFRRFQLPHFRLIEEQLRYRNTDRPHARRNVFKRNLIGNIFLVYIFIRFGGLSREEALKPRILFTLLTLYQGEIFVRGFVFGVKKVPVFLDTRSLNFSFLMEKCKNKR